MEKKFVVKDFETKAYYFGEQYGWIHGSHTGLAHLFDSHEKAEEFIMSNVVGKFQIEIVYVIKD